MEQSLKLSGYFWIPSDESNKLPGTLLINEVGDIELEVLGNWNTQKNLGDDEYEIPIICGNVENKNYITLENNFYISEAIPFPDIVSKSKIVSNYAYMGIAFKDTKDLMFDTFKFELDGFGEWLGKYNIDTDFLREEKTFIVKSTLEKNTYEYDLGEGSKLSFEFSQSGKMANNMTSEVIISQNISLKLTSKTKKTLKDFIYISYKLINFFSFAINETLSIKNVKVSNKDIVREIHKKNYPVAIEVNYKSLNTSERKIFYHPHEMLFIFSDIESSFESKIQNWLKNYQMIEPTMNLYFSVRRDKHSYTESKFLFLIQALETYHRRISKEKYMDDDVYKVLLDEIVKCCPDKQVEWLRGKLKFGNEISLRTRIKRIIEPFKDLIGNAKDRKNLISKIVDTRNYLTHYNDDLLDNATTGVELYNLNKKLEGLLELLLLKELSFSEKEIENIFKKIIIKKFNDR